MYPGGALPLLLLVAVAGAGAMCGFAASVVILRNKRRNRGYFILGVLTGWLAAAMAMHGRRRRWSLFSAVGSVHFGLRRILGQVGGRTAYLPSAVAALRRVRVSQTR
jgi:hypothetical protein